MQLLALYIFGAGVYAEGPNIVSNPGFEEGQGPEAFIWTKGSWAGKGLVNRDSSVKYSGSWSAGITNNEADDSRYNQIISVRENTLYKFSCRIRTENVGTDAKGANLSFEGLTDTSPDIKGTSGEWRLVEIYGRTGNDQKSLTLTVGLGGYGSINTGKAWFDDVSVEQVDILPAGVQAVNLFLSPANTNPIGGSTALWAVLLIFATLFSGVLFYFTIRRIKHAGYVPGETADRSVGEKGLQSRVATPCNGTAILDKKDYIIMISMTLIYAVIALINLGSLKVPQTSWTPKKAGASFVIDLGREVDLSRITYYCALGQNREAKGKYRVESADDPATRVAIGTLEKNTVFAWKYIDIAAKARRLKFIADNPAGTISEIGLFEKGSMTPVKGARIIGSGIDTGNAESLFDEQDKVAYHPTYMNSTYFDEIYYPRTAYEYLHRIEPFENTHPPLGKIFISLGVVIFGMNPFGWRIVGTLFGVALVPLMYAFGKKLFECRFSAFCAAFLMMFDFMHFAQTRIATIDVYGTFFIILMYYFMFDYYVNKPYMLGFKRSLRPLFLSGLFFGLGLACKWISLYGGAGLAVLFLISKYNEYTDYSELMRVKSSKRAAWVRDYVSLYLIGTVLFCVLFFVIVPGIIYIMSYIPFMLVPGPGHGLKEVFSSQSHMYAYHSTLKASHPFSSPWYEWPFIIKPIWFYGGEGLSPGKSSVIVTMGNPAIWWTGIAAVFAAMAIAFSEHNRKMIVVFIAIAFQYLPWALVPRLTFIYHFFSTLPFVILSIVYVIRYFILRVHALKYLIWAYLALVAGLFIVFYPALSGMEISGSYISSLKLLQGWIF